MPDALIPSLVGISVLAAVTTAVLWAFKVPKVWAPAAAILRGTLQLAVISTILTGVISSNWGIAALLVVMYAVATWVATTRAGKSGRMLLVAATSIAAGVGVAAGVVFATGALELTPRYALALGAMTIGNAMGVVTLTVRRFTSSLVDGWDVVEGWLALGATPRVATLTLARSAVHEALIPAVDQTRTTGLVVLPGAFVGAIFGGLSPLEAGRFQIVVLAAVMAAGAITAVLTVLWLGSVRNKPAPLT